MDKDVYEKLAQKLDACPSGFPRTDTGIEIKLLKKIFTPEEAALATELSFLPETADQISERTGRDHAETTKMLGMMTQKGQITGFPMGEDFAFIFLPFIVGIYFFQVGSVDEEMARLFEEYHKSWAEGVLKTSPTHHRVITINKSIPVEFEIFPHEGAETILMDAKSFGLFPCMCRLQKEQLGEGCDHPKMTCLVYSSGEGAFDGQPGIQTITREEAFQSLKDFEDAGLVHTVGNVRESSGGMDYICSCCTCSCTFLRALSEYGIENSVAKSNFYSVVNEEVCDGCGICLDRCQFGAISVDNDMYRVDRHKCTGCGLCVVKCPPKALGLVRKSEDETVHIPRNIQEFNKERAEARGMSMMNAT